MRSKLLQKLLIGSTLKTVASAIQSTNAHAVHMMSEDFGRYFGSFSARTTYAKRSSSTRMRKVKFLPVMKGKKVEGNQPLPEIIKAIKGTRAMPTSNIQR